MIKIILTLILIFTSFLIGNSFSVRLISRRKTLTDILESMSKIKTQICFGNMDVYTVLSQSFGEIDGFEAFNYIDDETENFTFWYKNCLSKISPSKGLTKEDMELITKFFSVLGVTDIEGQISNCELYTTLIKEQLKKAETEELKKCRLYRVLGFSFGSITALMLL